MISFKHFIKENKGEFKYIKLPLQRARNIEFDIKFKNELRHINGNISYQCIYKVPIWEGDVDFNRQREIKLHDVDVLEISNLQEIVKNEDRHIIYSQFKTGTSKPEADYLKSMFAHYFITGIMDGSIVTKGYFSVAQDVQKQLQKNRGYDIL